MLLRIDTSKIKTAAATRTKALAVTVEISAIQPIKGGNTAPPETAMIINPEISLALSGYFSMVREKTSGKIFAIPSPTMKMTIKAVISVGANTSATSDSTPNIDDHTKNLDDERRASIMAPANVPSILPKKYRLLPDSASVCSDPNLARRNCPEIAFTPTSIPTTRKIQITITATNPLLSNLKEEANVALFSLFFVSTILVADSHRTDSNDTIPNTINKIFQSPN